MNKIIKMYYNDELQYCHTKTFFFIILFVFFLNLKIGPIDLQLCCRFNS